MIEPYAIAVLAALAVISSVLVFLVKRILHAVVALTLVFAVSAFVFFLLGQTMLALLQLLVFIGGLSTYLIVAIASERRINRVENIPLLVVLAIIFFAGLATVILYLPGTATQQSTNIGASAQGLFQQYYAFLYVITFLLFAATIGSALVARRFVRLVM